MKLLHAMIGWGTIGVMLSPATVLSHDAQSVGNRPTRITHHAAAPVAQVTATVSPPKPVHVTQAPRVHIAHKTVHQTAPRMATAAAAPATAQSGSAAAPQSSAAAPQSIAPGASQPPPLSAMAGVPAWDGNWHNNQSYNWAAWRAAHPALFQPGSYRPPHGGYAYAAIKPGTILPAEFLAEQYWVQDPSIYHLPPATGSYQWIRYYNDILLVNIDSGRVMEVVTGLFR